MPWFQDLHVIPLNLAAESLGLRKADFNWKATSWHASQTAATRLPLARVQTSAGAHRGNAFLL